MAAKASKLSGSIFRFFTSGTVKRFESGNLSRFKRDVNTSQSKSGTQSNSYLNSKKLFGAGMSVTAVYAYYLYHNRRNNSKGIQTVNALVDKPKNSRKFYNFIADVVEESANAVVTINCTVRQHWATTSEGAGFVVRSDGLIITNAHVVQNGITNSVQVTLRNGKTYHGTVLVVDNDRDLALIKIDAKQLPVLLLNTEDTLRTGEWVISFGCPLSLKDSATISIVSSPVRVMEQRGKMMRFIQTDALLTTGNSGGPLVNLDGEVVGVNVSVSCPGIAFAIPSDDVKRFLDKCLVKTDQGHVRVSKSQVEKDSEPNKDYIGIWGMTVTPEVMKLISSMCSSKLPDYLEGSVFIYSVKPGSPAHLIGLKDGDLVYKVNGRTVGSVASLLNSFETGCKIEFLRNGTSYCAVVKPTVPPAQ